MTPSFSSVATTVALGCVDLFAGTLTGTCRTADGKVYLKTQHLESQCTSGLETGGICHSIALKILVKGNNHGKTLTGGGDYETDTFYKTCIGHL